VATRRFDVIKNCIALTAFKTSANTVNVNKFLWIRASAQNFFH